jgi:hypothetical protein
MGTGGSGGSRQEEGTMMRRGPGLLGTMARTAVVAGTATAVSGGAMRRQQNRAQQASDAAAYQQQQDAQAQQKQAGQTYAQPESAPGNRATPGPGPATPGEPDVIDKLRQLADLRASGALDDAEFSAAKAKLLGT